MSSNFEMLHEIINQAYAENFSILTQNMANTLLNPFPNRDPLFFDPEKVKKRASKVAHNRPRPFYSTVQPRPQPTAQN